MSVTSRIPNVAFLGLLVFLSLFSDRGFGTAEKIVNTQPHVVLGVGARGILPCRIQRRALSVEWKRQLSPKTESLVSLDPFFIVGKRDGSGYETGMFNITDDYSLVIKEVKVQDEGLYICSFSDYQTGKNFRNSTIVSVQAFPDEPFPVIKECMGKDVNSGACTLSIQETLNLTCFVRGYYPEIDLFFLHGSENVTPTAYKEWNNADGTRNKEMIVQLGVSNEPYECVTSGIPGIEGNRSVTVIVKARPQAHPHGPNAAVIAVPVIVGICLSVAAIFKYHRRNRRGWWSRHGYTSAAQGNTSTYVNGSVENIQLSEDDIPDSVVKETKQYYIQNMCHIQPDPTNYDVMFEFDHIYTNLKLLEEDRNNRKIGKPLLYSNLLKTKVNGLLPKRLLVQGEGGTGKTTLCAKIAWDWANELAFQQFRLVAVIPLRKAKNKTVGDMVKTYLSDNNPIKARQIDHYIISHPEYVFLVLDGLDEFDGEFSDLHQIVQIILNLVFKSGVVLITSRQWRAYEIRRMKELRKVYAFIEIEGFSIENVAQYIRKFFQPDKASSDELVDFIANNDVIVENMAPFPIYIAMLCIMWKEYDGERREAMSKLATFSQLFDEMFSFLTDHFLSKGHSLTGPSLQEGREAVSRHLASLGQIAFQGILDRRLVFPEDTFQNCKESLKIGCQVGVLTREKHATPRRDRRKNPSLQVSMVQFPHKLFQEFLAALHLASLHGSDRSKYEMNIGKLLGMGEEIRYLLYFMSAQGEELGLDIAGRLLVQYMDRDFRFQYVDRHFLVDVAYESQNQAVAMKVGNQLMARSISSRKLEITDEMTAHTASGLLFVRNQISHLNSLALHRSCGRTVSQDLAEFILSTPSLRSLQTDKSMHDVFYSVLANGAELTKVEIVTLITAKFAILEERDSKSRHLARFISKMPFLRKLHFIGGKVGLYLSSASLGLSPRVITLEEIPEEEDKLGLPSAPRNPAEALCCMPRMNDLRLRNFRLSEFYSVMKEKAPRMKVATLWLEDTHQIHLHGQLEDLSCSESRDFAEALCSMSHLSALTLKCINLNEVFYSVMKENSSRIKVTRLCLHHTPAFKTDFGNIPAEMIPSVLHDLGEALCSLPHLNDLELNNMNFLKYFSAKMKEKASNMKVTRLSMKDVGDRLRYSRELSASNDLANAICSMPHLNDLIMEQAHFGEDFYTVVKENASHMKVTTLILEDIAMGYMGEDGSRDLAEALYSMPLLNALTLRCACFHDIFYSVMKEKATLMKVVILCLKGSYLHRYYGELNEFSSSASRDLAEALVSMPHLHALTLKEIPLREDFYSVLKEKASRAKVVKLCLEYIFLMKDGVTKELSCSSSRDLAEALSSMPHLNDLTLRNMTLHGGFYSVIREKASCMKVTTFCLEDIPNHHGGSQLSSSASRDLAGALCSMPHLNDLTFKNNRPHDDFYSVMKEEASHIKGFFPQVAEGEFRLNGDTHRDIQSLLNSFEELLMSESSQDGFEYSEELEPDLSGYGTYIGEELKPNFGEYETDSSEEEEENRIVSSGEEKAGYSEEEDEESNTTSHEGDLLGEHKTRYPEESEEST